VGVQSPLRSTASSKAPKLFLKAVKMAGADGRIAESSGLSGLTAKAGGTVLKVELALTSMYPPLGRNWGDSVRQGDNERSPKRPEAL